MGISQPTISQYFRGIIALRNAKTLAAFAKALQVAPEEIDPSFKNRSIQQTPSRVTAFTENDVRKDIAVRLVAKENDLIAFVSGKDNEPCYEKGTIFLGDRGMLLAAGKLVVVLLSNKRSAMLRTLQSITARQLTVSHKDDTEHYSLKDVKFVIPVSHIQL
tara:strand:- start:5495 stop:5977 length:483 start_codon:yes stop_codon:yes gene_type:complete